MAFGWGTAGKAASDALQEIREAQHRQALEDAKLAMDREEMGLRQRVLIEQLTATQEGRERAGRDQRLQEAQIALGQAEAMGQGAELSPDVLRTLEKTPYGVRVERKATLPTFGLNPLTGERQAGDAGGREYATVAPTIAQQREQGQREGRRRVVELFKRGAPRQEILGSMVDAGQDITAAFLDDPEAARAQRIAEIQEGGRQQRLTQSAAEAARQRVAQDVTPRDRVSAIRQADAAAADYLSSLGGDYGILPDGVNADEIRERFREEYLDALELAPGQPSRGQTRRTVDGLSRIVAAPTRTGGQSRRLMVDVLPSGSGRTPVTGGGDAYEQYLARQQR